jgi:hypothetical protein
MLGTLHAAFRRPELEPVVNVKLMISVLRLLPLLSLTPISGAAGSLQESAWVVYLRSAGPVQIGMSVAEVRSRIGDSDAYLVQAPRQRRELPHEPDDSPCAYMVSARIPEQIGLMFERGNLVRIDVYDQGIRTASGAQVGDTESRILDVYPGKIDVQQHRYPPAGAHYMIFTPVDQIDRDVRMLFETDGTYVTRYRTGLAEAVANVEGCA